VDFTINVCNRVVDHFVLEFVQAIVGFQRIGKDRRTGKYVLADFGLKGFLFSGSSEEFMGKLWLGQLAK
jgi:hypothetical protein